MKSDAEILTTALVRFEQKISQVTERMKDIDRHLGIRYSTSARAQIGEGEPKRRSIGTLAKKRIAAAQKEQWAEFHKQKGELSNPVVTKAAVNTPANKPALKPKGKLSETQKTRLGRKAERGLGYESSQTDAG